MEGIAGIAARIAEIRTQLAGFDPPQAAGTTAPAFESALSAASAALRTPEGVPAELVKYGNGRIPEAALAQVGDTRHRLWAPAATSLEALMRAARADGVTIGITDSYRPYAEQVDLARRKGLYSQGGLAAKPGTSDHGWGMAVDLDLDDRAQAWMRANAGRFGFAEDTPREPWHWKYR
ncbi:D-alanyl-D-alanine carboxypeptidase family protein [Dactylosporangium sucinum]|uniref:M15 family metallopeptidase n=1 Tax=Dactylosporangium sucinum TaxID=1424081 RepID=UPI00167CA7B5|nr:M15 family metallopeptidase [Dactylosporangium sucinum]